MTIANIFMVAKIWENNFCVREITVFWAYAHRRGVNSNIFWKKRSHLLNKKVCHHSPILGIPSSTRGRGVGGSIKIIFKKKFAYFFYYLITAQYKEYVLWPEVSMTFGSGCFGLTRVGGGGGSKLFRERKNSHTFFLKIVSSQPNIRNMFIDQRSPRPPEEGVSRWNRHKDGHRDSMTKSAQWVYSVNIID